MALDEEELGSERLDDPLGKKEEADTREVSKISPYNDEQSEAELHLKIDQELESSVKECMEWERKILHSIILTYLKHGVVASYYHMPTL